MKYALYNNQRIEASPELKHENVLCLCCEAQMIPKCGEINIWHWSHKNLNDCDQWYESETEWHRNWKDKFPKECQEIIIKKEEETHIADIKLNKLVIEFQNSPISMHEALEREEFYDNMFWVFNGINFKKNFNLRRKKNNKAFATFRWKHPRKTLWSLNKKVFIDFGDYLFEIKKVYNSVPCGGWGYYINKSDFIDMVVRIKTTVTNNGI